MRRGTSVLTGCPFTHLFLYGNNKELQNFLIVQFDKFFFRKKNLGKFQFRDFLKDFHLKVIRPKLVATPESLSGNSLIVGIVQKVTLLDRDA